MPESSSYWIATPEAIRCKTADWHIIAPYERPVRRYLQRRFPALPETERDDIVQDVLITMREGLIAGYDPSRGRFRSLLSAVVANAVRDRFRRRRPAALLEGADAPASDPPPPEEAEVDAIDLEAEIIRAVRLVHDRYAHGPRSDTALVEVMSLALVEGRSNLEIARARGVSPDAVKRLLQRARREILTELLASLVGVSPTSVTAERAADLARACLREPRRETRLLEDEPDPRCREAVSTLTSRLHRARSLVLTASGEDGLLERVEAVFGNDHPSK